VTSSLESDAPGARISNEKGASLQQSLRGQTEPRDRHRGACGGEAQGLGSGGFVIYADFGDVRAVPAALQQQPDSPR
jgi:hypothetical protein